MQSSGASGLQQGVDGVYEFDAAGAELADALAGDELENFLAARQHGHQNFAAVISTANALYISVNDKAIDEFDDAVVLENQAFG